MNNVSAVFSDPAKYRSLLDHCGVKILGPGPNYTHPTAGKFDFLCLYLLNITTAEQCEKFAGRGITAWELYSIVDIWTRIEVWKIPLVLLLIQFARPPLACHTHLFTLLQLLGDPVFTIASLLYTLAACQYRALSLRTPADPTKSPISKRYALLLQSYDECGNRGKVDHFIYESMQLLESTDEFPEVRAVFHNTAHSLAADRQTKFLTTFYALFLFIQAFGFAFYKTQQSDKASLSNLGGKLVNIEAHSIAFSALLLWLVPAVYFGSIIGVSQSDEELPNKLNHFRKQLLDLRDQSLIKANCRYEIFDLSTKLATAQLPIQLRSQMYTRITGLSNHLSCLPDFPIFTHGLPADIPISRPEGQANISYTDSRAYLNTRLRLKSGAMYSCRVSLFSERNPLPNRTPLSQWTIISCHAIAWILVAASVAVAMAISWRVPPVGNSCRLLGETVVLLAWVSSYLSNFIIIRFTTDRWQYQVLYFKDFIFGSAIIVLIVITQVGIFNRCSCYIGGGGIIANPLIQAVGDLLNQRFIDEWLPVVMCGILFQLVVVMGLSWWYIVAFRVFLQRSDNKSNFDHIRGIGGPLKWVFNKLEDWRLLGFRHRAIVNEDNNEQDEEDHHLRADETDVLLPDNERDREAILMDVLPLPGYVDEIAPVAEWHIENT